MLVKRKFNFVYLTICKINGKGYVGSHCTDKEDLDVNRYFGGGNLFKLAFKKYGKENFHRIILKECEDLLEARTLEKYYIDLFDTIKPNGYNLSPSGGMERGIFGIHSQYSKEKMSQSRLGKIPWNKGKTGIYKEETLEKFRNRNLFGDKNPNYGNIGEKSKIFGVKKSQEHKDKLAISKKGQKNPNAGTYEIITPDKQRFLVFSATDFINQHPEYKINRHFIYGASKSKKGNYKGWKIKKLN